MGGAETNTEKRVRRLLPGVGSFMRGHSGINHLDGTLGNGSLELRRKQLEKKNTLRKCSEHVVNTFHGHIERGKRNSCVVICHTVNRYTTHGTT